MLLCDLNTTLQRQAPAIANHLWQSTAFAAAAGLLTLALRKNSASARHWVWVAASLKFLLPFALLSGIAARFAAPVTTAPATPALYYTVDDFSEPFTAPATSIAPPAVITPHLQLGDWLPLATGAIWLVGFITVLIVWTVRWRRVTWAVRVTQPMHEARELKMLRALERTAGLRRPIRAVVAESPMEPGVFGVFRPVLVWPAGISERLDDAHLEAVLAHEVCHVRRRDNLLAALHMFVEAAFWFHPLAWWMGARLMAERERACDEAVLELLARPQVYAESILKVCEFCVESPLECVAGITGADLKRRIVEIMQARSLLRLTWGKRLLIAAAMAGAAAVPVVMGLAGVPLSAQIENGKAAFDDWVKAAGDKQAFDVASIREDKNADDFSSTNVPLGPEPVFRDAGGVFSATNTPVVQLISFAYKITTAQRDVFRASLPDWAKTVGYNIEARTDNHAVTKDEMRLMMQSLLAERFQVKVHWETREVSVYAVERISPDALGPGLQPHPADDACSMTAPPLHPADDDSGSGAHTQELLPGGFPTLCGSFVNMPPTQLYLRHEGGRRLTIAQIASTFTGMGNLGRPVVDRTGLTGTYDWVMEFIDERPGHTPPPDADGMTFEEALKKQTGLKLVAAKAPVDFLVVDHIDRPTVDGAEVQQSAVSLRYVAMMQPAAGAQGSAVQAGAAPDKALEFEVAAVKPSSQSKDWGMGMDVLPDGLVKLTNVPAYSLVEYAYGVPYQSPRMSGGPEWVHTERYDIEAKAPEGTLPSTLTTKERNSRVRVMMQALLAERFKLSIQRQVKDVPVYNLVVGKGGPKLQPSKITESDCAAGMNSGEMRCHQLNGGQGRGLHGTAVNMTDIIKFVESWSDRPMIDQTGLTGLYAVDTEGWVPMRQMAPRDPNAPNSDEGLSDPLRQTLFSVFQGLGLRLEPSTAPTEVYEIDHMERPSAN